MVAWDPEHSMPARMPSEEEMKKNQRKREKREKKKGSLGNRFKESIKNIFKKKKSSNNNNKKDPYYDDYDDYGVGVRLDKLRKWGQNGGRKTTRKPKRTKKLKRKTRKPKRTKKRTRRP